MSENPPLWGRMFAWVQGEIPTTTLEAYRRASGPVFELMDRVEARRQACLIDGLTPWTIPSATRAELLCAWNAFVLQTLGNDLLDADYSEYPPTAGYVPPVTAQQVMAFFGEVEGWVDRAHQAYANPDYLLDVEVPAALPPWCEDDAPPSHLRGLLEAMRAVGDHVAAAVATLPETVEEPDQRAQLNRIRQLHASAQGKARYAADLHGNDPPRGVQDRAEPYARQAIEMFYELGQLIADPALAARNQPPPRRATAPKKPAASKPTPRKRPPHPAPVLEAKPLPLPGEPGFDAWCLTAPAERARREDNPVACSAIRRLWEADPDPARTLELHGQILAAMDAGFVVYADESGGPTHSNHFPWGPVYVSVWSLRLGGVNLHKGQEFVYEVRSAGRKNFIRRVRPRQLAKT